jgi:hypothetical protein
MNIFNKEVESLASCSSRRPRSKWKGLPMLLVVASLAFLISACDDRYYGPRTAHVGYGATYGSPGPYYYGRDPYGYGRPGYVGRPRYRTGVAAIRVGTSSSRYYGTRPRYRQRGDYRRSSVRRSSGEYRRQQSVRRGRGERVNRRGSAARRGAAARDRARAEAQPE